MHDIEIVDGDFRGGIPAYIKHVVKLELEEAIQQPKPPSILEHRERYGWWGKFECFGDEERQPVMIWIGPMSYEDMKVEYCEFRHNFRRRLQ